MSYCLFSNDGIENEHFGTNECVLFVHFHMHDQANYLLGEEYKRRAMNKSASTYLFIHVFHCTHGKYSTLLSRDSQLSQFVISWRITMKETISLHRSKISSAIVSLSLLVAKAMNFYLRNAALIRLQTTRGVLVHNATMLRKGPKCITN